MHHQTLHPIQLSTLSWRNNHPIDWANSGRQFLPDGQTSELGSYHLAYPFDSAITSDDGVYAVVYKKLGTKGLLLKNGQVLREINRSYYQAEVYEYPLAFAKLKDGRTLFIHCPDDYRRLDFEDVETGARLTHHADRNPSDFFHSRLEVSPDQKTLLSKGWAWHPFDFVEVFDIEACIDNPLLLDKSKINPEVDVEICAASFMTNHLVLIGSPADTEPLNPDAPHALQAGQLAVWNLNTNEITGIVQPDFVFGGHLYVIDDTYAWDLYQHPKIVNFRTGKLVEERKDIASGNQVSSIIHHLGPLPKIAFNKSTKQVAIYQDQRMDILGR